MRPAEPRAAMRTTQSGNVRHLIRRSVRAVQRVRRSPYPLVRVYWVSSAEYHLKRYGTGSGGRVFTLARGGVLTDRAYLAVFHKARAVTFTKEKAASMLARRPDDLRHAAVSTWLKATADPPQVAEWAGHSVAVRLRVYAKCIAGQQDEAKRRIPEATQPTEVT